MIDQTYPSFPHTDVDCVTSKNKTLKRMPDSLFGGYWVQLVPSFWCRATGDDLACCIPDVHYHMDL